MSIHDQRCNKLRKSLKKLGLEALLVTDFTNVTYLTGFSGDDSYLIVTSNKIFIISDSRYTTQIENECPQVELVLRSMTASTLVTSLEVIEKAKLTKVGIEAASLTLQVYEQLKSGVPESTELVPTESLVEIQRQIKDKSEIEEIRKAVWYAEKGFGILRNSIQAEQTELRVAHNLEHDMRKLGAVGCSFPPIVAVGSNAALPHARPSDRKIGDDSFVLIDWGASSKGYKSDLTRVLVTGKISPKLQRIHGVVLKAQLAAIEAIRPGIEAKEVDQIARKIITDAKFGPQFGHSLGHGLGLYIHEGPRLSVSSKDTLEPGMVITIEPGIYLPGWGGVRIEDDVLVTKDGHEVLTSTPKELEECVVDLIA